MPARYGRYTEMPTDLLFSIGYQTCWFAICSDSDNENDLLPLAPFTNMV